MPNDMSDGFPDLAARLRICRLQEAAICAALTAPYVGHLQGHLQTAIEGLAEEYSAIVDAMRELARNPVIAQERAAF